MQDDFDWTVTPLVVAFRDPYRGSLFSSDTKLCSI